MPKVAFEAELLGAADLARSALLEITEESTIGEQVGHEVDASGAVTLFFACTMPGYPGWRWAASLAKVAKDAPVTVLEVELLPSEGALLSPEWVPWSERLASYRESQAEVEAEQLAAAAALHELGEIDDDDDDDEDDILVNDFSDFDDEIDGVDIDALADTEELTDELSDELPEDADER